MKVGVSGDALRGRETYKMICHILEESKGEWHPIRKIMDIGEEKYPGFPKRDTINRYLTSMTDEGTLEVKKPEKNGLAYEWRLIAHPYTYEELVFEYDLNALKELGKHLLPLQGNMHNIMVFGPVTICNFPLYDFKECDKEIKEIVTILKDAGNRLDELYMARMLHLVTNYIDTLREMKAPLLDKQLISIFTSGLEDKVPSKQALRKWDKQINEWIRETLPADNKDEKRLVVSKDLSLAKLLKNKYYPSKEKSEILELIADHYVEKNVGDCFLHLYLMLSDIVMMPHPIAIVRSSVTDRKNLVDSYSKEQVLVPRDSQIAKVLDEMKVKHKPCKKVKKKRSSHRGGHLKKKVI